MSNSVYGYWIARDEIIEVVHECSHAEIAYEVLSEQFSVRIGRITRSEYSVYRFMFRLGYVRVINYDDGDYGVEYRHDAKLSKLQKEFVKDAYQADIVAHNGKTIRVDYKR